MTISNFASKILSFLLVPLYTSVLTTAEFGTYDLYSTTAFLLVPLLSGCVSQAVLRFALESEDDSREVFSIGMRHFIRASIIVVILILLNYHLGIAAIFKLYPWYFIAYYVLCLLSDILSSFARGVERIFDTAVSGIISSAATIGLNILLLVVFPCGIEGYFIANCAAFAASIIYLAIRLQIWRYFTLGRNKGLEKSMLDYSRPLVFDQIGWWINNVSDRYIVTWLCGTAANGIYSVAFKIPSILNMFQTIFNQAWTLSAVKELDDKGKAFYSNIYKLYNCCLVVVCSLLIAGDKIIAKILYANDFYGAWEYAPFLTLSVVFGCLSGVFEGVFAAAKKTKILAHSTIVGAVINLSINLLLVKKFGPMGAALATLVSYVSVWAIRLYRVKAIVSFDIDLCRDLVSYVCLVIQSVVLLLKIDPAITAVLECLGIFLIVAVNRCEVSHVCAKLIKRC